MQEPGEVELDFCFSQFLLCQWAGKMTGTQQGLRRTSNPCSRALCPCTDRDCSHGDAVGQHLGGKVGSWQRNYICDILKS